MPKSPIPIPSPGADVRIRPYAAQDLSLLERLLGDPEITVYIGGPESPDGLRARHERDAGADPSQALD